MRINLEEHRTPGSLVFSGRKRGRAVRDSTELRNFDPESEDDITINIPEDNIAITSSFLLGMLGDVIRDFGEEAARARINFNGPITESTVDEAIDEALRGDEPLIGTE
jgi:hypothetical protein